MLQRRQDGDGNYLKTAGNVPKIVPEIALSERKSNGARFCDFNLISQKKVYLYVGYVIWLG